MCKSDEFIIVQDILFENHPTDIQPEAALAEVRFVPER